MPNRIVLRVTGLMQSFQILWPARITSGRLRDPQTGS